MKILKTFKEFEKLDIEIRAKAAQARKKNPGKSAAQINKKNVEEIKEPKKKFNEDVYYPPKENKYSLKEFKPTDELITKFKLFEYGDYVSAYDASVENGYPFAYNKKTNEIKLGSKGKVHKNYKMFHPCNEPSSIWYWHGRLWKEEKIMTFWYYPEPDKFKEIIDLLEEEMETKIWNDGWKIQTYQKEDTEEIIYGGDCEKDEEYHDAEITLIPIEEYAGGIDAPEEERIIHLLSYAEKQELKKKGWGKGWGSDMTAWDSKNPLAWRQAKYQENKQEKF